MRATERAGHQAAAIAVRTASTRLATTAHHGRARRSIRWPESDCSVGTNANHAATPTTPPASAPTIPTAAPSASITRRTCLSVAPREASRPRARIRRWAMTVNPATAMSPTKSRPSVPSARTSASTAAVLGWPRDWTCMPVPLGSWIRLSGPGWKFVKMETVEGGPA